MESADPNPPLKYTVHADLKVYEKYLRRDGKDRLREWIYHALRQIPNYGFLCAGGYVFGQLVGGTTSWPGIIAAMSMGVVIGPVSTFMDFDGSVHRVLEDLKGKSWDCTLAEEGYQLTDNDGVTSLFPWQLMRIEKSDPDYWEVSCRKSILVVFRQPLRQAGFEEEFERRLGKDSVVTLTEAL